jgi:VanZ family protein
VQWVRWATFLVYTGVLTGLLVMPPSPLTVLPAWLMACDKVAHFVLFGLQAAFLVRALPAPSRAWGWAVLFCCAYGVFTEYIQGTHSEWNRTFSYGDVAADFAGVALSGWLASRRPPRLRE